MLTYNCSDYVVLKWWISHAVCLFICIIRFGGKSILD